MKRKTWLFTAVLLMLTLALSACRGIIPQTGSDRYNFAATQQAFIEQAAQATATSIAFSTQVAQLQTQMAQAGQAQKTAVSGETSPTAVPPTATLTLTPTATFTATSTATATPVPPTATPLPLTATPIPCNAAQFIGDVSVPDGTVYAPNTSFTKTWRLKNTGTCAWTTAYSIVPVSDRGVFNAPAAVNLPGYVAPGQVVDVSVNLTAPSSEGSYRGHWKLRDGFGVLFGTGRASNSFYVDIQVKQPASNAPMDFVANMCSASWSSGAGSLPCPGQDNDARGFVLRVDNPTLESGYKDDEPVLLMYPQMISNGTISGKYPAYHVHTGDHFRSIIGCGYQTEGCDVKFELAYQIGSGTVTTLKTWREAYEGLITTVDIDLGSLVGQDVKFILSVTANGSSNHNRAQWLLPRIER